MEEILHQSISSLSHYLQGFFTPQVVQDINSRSTSEAPGRRLLTQKNLPKRPFSSLGFLGKPNEIQVF